MLENFALIDDNDISTSVKVWQSADDKILAKLCKDLSSRHLFKTTISKESFTPELVQSVQKQISEKLAISVEDTSYFMRCEKLVNNAYDEKYKQINIKLRNGEIMDLAKASDNLNIAALATPVEKYYLCRVKF